MRTFFINDSFVDFKGNTRPFILCGVLLNVQDGVDFSLTLYDFEGILSRGSISDHAPESMLRVGLSICHEDDLDRYKEVIGKKQAEGRAMKIGKSLCVYTGNNKLMLNQTISEHLLKALAEDIKYSPGKYIKGYNEMEARYLKNQ